MTKKLTFKSLKKIKKSERANVLEDVGEALIEGILDYVGSGKSPVVGGQYKKKLSPAYAKQKGSDLSNMELSGEMLDSLEVKISGDSIEVGFFDPDEAAKAAGHHSGATPWDGYKQSKLPVREFIPREKQNFKKEIMNAVMEIIDNARED